ncbi:MAG: carbamoyltransferase [Candidatus Omnitrophota bacterium]|nr:MAG: carbamoyltransferase [Candidatus Omnitrophota bacterium]
MKMNILGIHTTHDAGAALISDGKIIAAVNEERFNRIKHYGFLPINSIDYCLKKAGIGIEDIDIIATSSSVLDPSLKLLFNLSDREISKVYPAFSQLGNLKARIKSNIYKYLEPREVLPDYISSFKIKDSTKILPTDHHLAHAASAYYTSGFKEKCLVVSADGVGDNISIAIYRGENGKLTLLKNYGIEGSLGLFYGMVTESMGWWVGDGEPKTMGLAAYGDPNSFPDFILKSFMPEYENGTLKKPYNYAKINRFKLFDCYHFHFSELSSIKRIKDTYGDKNIAAKAQYLLEKEMIELIGYWAKKEGVRRLATSGGVFLNVKLNQKIVEANIIDEYHVFPNAGDGGLALGAALYQQFNICGEKNIPKLEHLFLGPEFSNYEVESILKGRNIPYEKVDDAALMAAKLLAQGRIIGWFQGRMEYGPRALGNRSILADPRKKENTNIINEKVKFREWFRPFCPSLLYEVAEDYFHTQREEFFMITAYSVRKEKVNQIPAVVHVDGTSRPQLVKRQHNEKFWRLIKSFQDLTGTAVVLNTSFNIKGEPMILSPRDALKCFFDTGIDNLIINDFLISKD